MFPAVVREIVAETWHAHGRIIFNGNNYSAEWAAEAARRGLPNIQSMVDAADGFIAEKNVAMFERTKVFTAAECAPDMRSRWKRTPSISTSTPPRCWRWQAAALLPASYEYLSRVSRAEYYAERNGCACASAKAQVEKLCVTIDKTAGAMEALRRALHALDTAHLGEKARRTPAARCASTRWPPCARPPTSWRSLCPRRTGPCQITASCCSTCKARCSRLLCAKIILQTQNGPVPGGCKPRDRAVSLFRRGPRAAHAAAQSRSPRPAFSEIPSFRKSPSWPSAAISCTLMRPPGGSRLWA